MLGIGLALGVGSIMGGLAGVILGTGRDMYKDNLISKKEMAEIEAKERSFKKLVEHYNFKIEKGFDLEREVLVGIREFSLNLVQMVNTLIEKIDRTEDAKKIDVYSDKIDNILLQITTIQCSDPKYFTQNFLDSINPTMIDYHNNSEIGLNYKEEKIDFKSELLKIAGNKRKF